MDMISQLPDDLLMRILSSVSTKDVLNTTLLSKRWRYLRILVPHLEYDDTNHSGDYKTFFQFVFRSMISNKAPFLQNMVLKLGPKCPSIDIELWIGVAVSRGVRNLDIHIPSRKEGCITLLSNIYTSETLETLILLDFVLLKVPLSVCLPSLRVLRLNLVYNVDNTSLTSLLSGCPNLEELQVLRRHNRKETKGTTVVVPSLKRFSMIDEGFGAARRYVIDCPCLKYLNIKDEVVYESRQIEYMPELVEARVEILQGVNQQFLRALSSVRRLSLCVAFSEVMSPSSMIFSQLVHLKFYTYCQGWWDVLTYILQVSPKLRSLKLIDKHEDGLCGKEAPIGWKLPSSVPECLLFSLEAFEWDGYKGRKGDREVSTYVLKNASCLKTATFFPESTELWKKYKMLKALASIPTASTSSQLLFD